MFVKKLRPDDGVSKLLKKSLIFDPAESRVDSALDISPRSALLWFGHRGRDCSPNRSHECLIRRSCEAPSESKVQVVSAET